MTRQEILELRNQQLERVEAMRSVGDYGAGAKWAREEAETQLKILEHLLERAKT